jgi:hypothetical protein
LFRRGSPWVGAWNDADWGKCVAIAGEITRRQMASNQVIRSSRKQLAAGWKSSRKSMCDKPSPVRAVMLHLRARYVSKAAILTTPARHVPVENRSPA